MKHIKLTLIILITVFCSLYSYFSMRDYKYYNSQFTETIFTEDTFIRGGYYNSITQLAILYVIGGNSYPPANLDDILNRALSSVSGLDTCDYSIAFNNAYLTESNDYLQIISKGTDKMKSITGKFDSPEKVSYFEFMFNLKDIVLAREYYGIDSYNKWSSKVFLNDNVDTINFLDRLNKILADERWLRFPEEYNYRNFYGIGNKPDGFFVSFTLQDNSWRVLWVTDKVKNQNINLDTVKIENLLDQLKNDLILSKVDSIHFPYYLP